MKKFIACIVSIVLFNTHFCLAELSVEQKEECKNLLDYAEKSAQAETWVYDYCEFDDSDIAWYDWAPYVSQQQQAKALFELCKRYPQHEYGELYCTKAAQLNFLPAIYAWAQSAKQAQEYDLYETHLQNIIKNTVQNDKSLSANVIKQAYFDLAKYYYENSTDEQKRQNIIPYLQKAADSGDIVSAFTLAALLYKNANIEGSEIYEKYLWQAIMKDCPAAEEFLGLIDLDKTKKISENQFASRSDSLLFSCRSSQKENAKQWTQQQVDDCACGPLLARLKLQQDKPFKIISLSADKAILQDKDGLQYTVSVGDKIADGYVLQDIRPTAVKIAKQAVSTTILFIDPQCSEICQDVLQTSQGHQTYHPYTLKFTQQECSKISENIEMLDNPLEPFRGVQQCQLQDWQRWGDEALKYNRKKHLFLLGDYKDSSYIPSFISLAQITFSNGGQKTYSAIAQLLKQAVQLPANDTLSRQRQDYAYCLLGALYIGPLQDNSEAIRFLSKGSEQYASSSNILGVIYANGWGVKPNQNTAQTYFEKAIIQDEPKSDVSIDAAHNIGILNRQEDVSKMQYGHCESILDPTPLQKDDILKIYQMKEIKK